MSLITRCPACGTMFKVVPDQLRISEGWVRCGHCSEVFDAASQLQDAAAGPTVPGELPAALPPAPLKTNVRVPPDSAPMYDPFPSSLTTEVGSSLPQEELDSVQLREEARELEEGPRDRPFVLQPVEEPLDQPSRPSVLPPAEPNLHDLSFVRDARRNEFWSRRPVRLVLSFLFLVLAAALAGQIALHDRDRLAATEPQLKPWLVLMCEHLSCNVKPPRQIEAIAIDSSSFNKLRPDTYRLSVTLKNQAGFEVEMPALELTLTDGQDQPVLRRVLMPADLQPRRSAIAGGGDWSGSMALAVGGNGAGSRVAGYRVLAFYP